MRQNAKRDADEEEHILMLRYLGATKIVKHSNRDEPDLWALFPWGWLAVEVKSRGGKLTPGQVKWHASLAGSPFACVAYSPSDLPGLVSAARVARVGGA